MRQLDRTDDLARLSFSFISQGDIYIGGLQGLPGPNSREIVSQASKACSGLSPKRMVMEAMFALVKQVGASAILGVPDEQHISRIKVIKYFSYNDYWNEIKAVRNENGDYLLPRLCQNSKSPMPVEIINGLLIELHFQMGVTIDSSLCFYK